MNILKLFGIGGNEDKDRLPTKREVMKSLAKTSRYEKDGQTYGRPNDDTTDGYIFCNMCCQEIEHCECRDNEAIVALIKRR